MKLKRLTVKLPASMAATSAHDSRAIAQAVGQALANGGNASKPIVLEGNGQRGTVLAGQVASALKGGSHGR